MHINVYIGKFINIVIKLLCCALSISSFFSTKSVNILISAKEQLELLSLFAANYFLFPNVTKMRVQTLQNITDISLC